MNAILTFLDGKKTIISAIGLFLVYGSEGMGWLSVEVAAWLKKALLAFGVVGLTHKLFKVTR